MTSRGTQTAVFGVIGGYGATGSVVVTELARRGNGAILIGGRTRHRAEALAARFDQVSVMQLDVLDEPQLEAFCARCRIVINCAGPIVEVGDRVAQVAFRYGCHYIDPGGFAVVCRTMEPWRESMQQRSLSCVLSAGWIPGLSEVLVRYADRLAATRLQSPGMLRLYLGDSSDWSTTGFRDIVWHSRNRLYPGVRYFRKGTPKLPGLLEFTRVVTLPPPLGRQRVYLYFNHEIEQFARQRRQGFAAYIGNFSLRTVVTMGAVAFLPRAAELYAVRLVRAAFRRDYASRLKAGFAVVQVEDHGREPGRILTVQLVEHRHYWLTGIVPAMVAIMLATGHPVERGVNFLGDAVDPMSFVGMLAEWGVVPEVTLDGGAGGGRHVSPC